MSKIYTGQVQLGALPAYGSYQTEYSYDGEASFVSFGGDADVATGSGNPLAGTGGDCTDRNTCEDLEILTNGAPGGPGWATYDFGGMWYSIDQVEVRNYHDGDWAVGISEDGSTWYFTNTHRISWASASCQTDTYVAANFSNPGGWSGNARYIRFWTDDVVLVGDRHAVAWFSVRGISPGSADILTDDVQLGALPTGSKIYPVGVYLGQ